MIQSTKISLLFIMIFILGIMGVIAMVNKSLTKGDEMNIEVSSKDVISFSQPGSF